MPSVLPAENPGNPSVLFRVRGARGCRSLYATLTANPSHVCPDQTQHGIDLLAYPPYRAVVQIVQNYETQSFIFDSLL